MRLRFTLLYVALLAVLLTALGIAVYLNTRHFLLSSTAVRLRAQAKPIIDDWQASHDLDSLHAGPAVPQSSIPTQSPLGSDSDAAARELARALTSRDTAAVIVDAHGRYLADGRMEPGEVAPAKPQARYVSRALTGENEVSYIREVSGERSLVIFIPLRQPSDHSRIFGVAQLNTPLAPSTKFC